MNKEYLKFKLDCVNKEIDYYKEKAIKEIEEEKMSYASSDLSYLRELKGQQTLLEKLIKEE